MPCFWTRPRTSQHAKQLSYSVHAVNVVSLWWVIYTKRFTAFEGAVLLYSPTATFHLTKSFRFGSQVAALATKVLRLKAPPPWHNEEQHGVWQHPSITGHGSDKVYRDIRAISKPHTRIYRTNALLTRDLLQLSLTLPENELLFLKTSQNLSHLSLIHI